MKKLRETRTNVLSELKRMNEKEMNFIFGGTDGSGSTAGHTCFCCDGTSTQPPIIIIKKPGYADSVVINDDNSVTTPDGTTAFAFTISDMNEISINLALSEYVEIQY
jgi:natural product precursor